LQDGKELFVSIWEAEGRESFFERFGFELKETGMQLRIRMEKR
jgi:hypothetical protein